jgi:hypothetical protein
MTNLIVDIQFKSWNQNQNTAVNAKGPEGQAHQKGQSPSAGGQQLRQSKMSFTKQAGPNGSTEHCKKK